MQFIKSKVRLPVSGLSDQVCDVCFPALMVCINQCNLMPVITCPFPSSYPSALMMAQITAVFFSTESEKNLRASLCSYNVVQSASTDVWYAYVIKYLRRNTIRQIRTQAVVSLNLFSPWTYLMFSYSKFNKFRHP